MYWLAWDSVCQSKERDGLGFRWLRSFNLAMLSKQCWRILKCPESLCSRILKAKYFRESDLLNAPACSSSSFFWQGVWEALKSFRRGLMNRVGNGLSIRIWEDNWIPTSNSKKLLLCLENDRSEWVAELIDVEVKAWDRSKLRRFFMESDVEEIIKIPISFRLPRDEMYWGLTRSGEFSVKSCYFLTEGARFVGTQVSSSSGEVSQAFKEVWKLSLPTKIKHFGWKLLRGILPTASLLNRCGVIGNGCCSLCGSPEETDLHALLVWRGSIDF
ncbi:Ribonuclease H-like superfamily protein [Euphorbia peplus]|nr:Ribonuclease H-like superfamily protein [Euphorbia peplus]